MRDVAAEQRREELTGEVARRIRAAREDADLTQAALGEALEAAIGGSWPAQRISVTERGGRPITVAEILALTQILGRPASWFFEGDTSEDEGFHALSSIMAHLLGDEPQLRERLSRALQHLRQAQDELGPIEQMVSVGAELVKWQKGEQDGR